MEMGKRIIGMALENGASVAGIASRTALQRSPSHVVYPHVGVYPGAGAIQNGHGASPHPLFTWPKAAQSVLVIGLAHPEDQPELDWWDGNGTPGNRRLIGIMDNV